MKLLDILEEDKTKLGKIIKYYRTNDYKINNPNFWSINDFIEDDNGYICSNTTLSSIENGEIIKDNDIYDKLLKKLNLKYNYKKDLSLLHNKYSSIIEEQFENFVEKDILMDSIKKYIDELKPYGEYVIEKEYIIALNFLEKNIYQMSTYEYNKLMDLLYIFPVGIQGILIANLLQYLSMTHLPTTIKENLKKYNIKSKRANLKYAWIVMYYVRNYYKAISIAFPIIKYYEEFLYDNENAMIEVDTFKIFFITATNSEEWNEFSNDFFNRVIQDLEKNKSTKLHALHNIGLTAMMKEEYEFAYKVFKIVVEDGSFDFFPIAFQMNIASILSNNEIPKKAIDKNYDRSKYGEGHNRIYEYYLLRYY